MDKVSEYKVNKLCVMSVNVSIRTVHCGYMHRIYAVDEVSKLSVVSVVVSIRTVCCV